MSITLPKLLGKAKMSEEPIKNPKPVVIRGTGEKLTSPYKIWREAEFCRA